MKIIDKNKPSISMRLDRMFTFFSHVIYCILSLLAFGAFGPILIEILYGASMMETKEAFLRMEMLWPAMPTVALLIFVAIGIFIIRAWIALVGWISGGKYKHKDIKESKIK